ncbi:MAG: hypothetical protein OXT09_37570 [Myxococcales bacterium]|nr:hypothetical protein [Myxococcales bacterium]
MGESGVMAVLIHDADGAFELEQRGDALLMTVLCGGIGLYEIRFPLDASERAEYDARGSQYLRELADEVRRDESSHRARNVT